MLKVKIYWEWSDFLDCERFWQPWTTFGRQNLYNTIRVNSRWTNQRIQCPNIQTNLKKAENLSKRGHWRKEEVVIVAYRGQIHSLKREEFRRGKEIMLNANHIV